MRSRGVKRSRSRSAGARRRLTFGRARVHRLRRRSLRVRRRARRNLRGPCTVINPGRPRVEVVKKSFYNAWTAFDHAQTDPDRDGVGLVATPYQYWYFNVDPTGSTTRHVRISHNTVTGTAQSETGRLTPSGHAFPDFGSYAGLYQFYKLRWVKFTFQMVTKDTSDGIRYPTMLCRALYDVDLSTTFTSGLTAGTSVWDKLLEYSRVKKMVFNADVPGGTTFVYKMYPRVYDSVVQAFKKPQWLDFDLTASAANRHYGLVVSFDDQLSADSQIAVHVEYCMAFKMRQ